MSCKEDYYLFFSQHFLLKLHDDHSLRLPKGKQLSHRWREDYLEAMDFDEVDCQLDSLTFIGENCDLQQCTYLDWFNFWDVGV